MPPGYGEGGKAGAEEDVEMGGSEEGKEEGKEWQQSSRSKAGEQAESDSDDDSSSEEENEEVIAAEVKLLTLKVSQNPLNFEVHSELISYLKSKMMFDELQQARKRFASNLPLPEGTCH